MASDPSLVDRAPGAVASLVLLLVAASPAPAQANADETPLVVMGPSRPPTPTLGPIVVLRLPLGADVLTISQLGWTSGVVFDAPREGSVRWESAVGVTPIRAHLSHGVFAPNGGARRRRAGRHGARSRPARSGTFRHVRVLVHAVGGKEWISGLAAPLAAPFDAPFGGGEAVVVLEAVRGEDPIASRLDGVRFTVRGEGFVGTRVWADANVALSSAAARALCSRTSTRACST